MTPQEARWRRAADLQKRRMAEQACATDFLRRGDTVGVHAKRCVFGAKDACSREYDPCPVPESTPDDRRMYEGTGIGTIYGWSDTESWQLAGWNITRRRRRR